MKKINLNVLFVAILAAFAFTSCNSSTTEETVTEETEVTTEETTEAGVSGDFTVNADASEVSWLGKKVIGDEHFGKISLQEGSFALENGALTSGSAVVDMTTITVEDIENEEYNAKLKGHLMDPDFFDVENNPTSSLEFSTDENGALVGQMTIKGITNDVAIEAETSVENDVPTVTGSVVVDRTLYDIKYGSGKFFENLGDKTISDEFNLTFTIVGQ